MTIEEARDLLIQFNNWRRDDHIPNAYEMPNPQKIGMAIDIAINVLSNMEYSGAKNGESDLKGLATREAQR